jgi:5'-deoxynucleotidase YfbR-like HD superfamily hydrolase/energy-coupling factor transporter ATP-binding protein EcfA2
MEMESAGILEAVGSSGIEVLIVRGVSDGADFRKKSLEIGHNDENRRFALEAATAILEISLLLRAEERGEILPNGITIITPDDPIDPNWTKNIDEHEALFSLLVQNAGGENVTNPIGALADTLQSTKYSGATFLFGEKGVGKTTLFQLLQRLLVVRQMESAIPAASILVRVSELELWSHGEIDVEGTRRHTAAACAKIKRTTHEAKGIVFVLVDGLNRTGDLRVSLVADILDNIMNESNLRLVISAESADDLHSLYKQQLIDVQNKFSLFPMDIEDAKLVELTKRFGAVVGSPNYVEVVENMRSKEVRSVDLFILGQFFKLFSGLAYRDFNTLAQCYELFCASKLSSDSRRSDNDQAHSISTVATTAFDILISKKSNFIDIKQQDVARLISNHSSVTNYLVAKRVVDVIQGSDRKKGRAEANRSLNFVFPAEVNSYTKQMMRSDRQLETTVVNFIRHRKHELGILATSHLAYLAGRVSEANALAMRDYLKELAVSMDDGSARLDRDRRMLRRTIFISRSLLGDHQAEVEYVNILLTDPDEAEFNRGFHLEYYGDAPFEPDGKMSSRDDGAMSCTRTFARLADRIRLRAPSLPLIELLTLLSLVQVRYARHNLRIIHRQEALRLLDSDQIAQKRQLPANVRGYIGRIREDLKIEKFDIITVLQEWSALSLIERTGWLRRKRDARDHAAAFWLNRRIESVAEHTFNAIGLATVFLQEHGAEPEPYDKARIVEMLMVHDLAEARLGDFIDGETGPEVEEEVLWQYGAFATYRGVGQLWRVPEAFQEFARQQTISARVARDLDRLHFMLQARLYAQGMSEVERDACEKTADKFTTETVRDINALLAGVSPPSRFNLVTPDY